MFLQKAKHEPAKSEGMGVRECLPDGVTNQIRTSRRFHSPDVGSLLLDAQEGTRRMRITVGRHEVPLCAATRCALSSVGRNTNITAICDVTRCS